MSMFIRPYIMKPDKEEVEVDEKLSMVERTQQQLAKILIKLESLVKSAYDENKDNNILPIVCCGEDFFQGGELGSEREEELKQGKCMDRDTVFEFFATQMRALSQRYPTVLIMPGSVYVSIDAKEGDQAKFLFNQDNVKKIKGSVYVQNISPVFFNGEWIRLIKKGDYLKCQSKSILSEEDLLKLPAGSRVEVPEYHEDTLVDINSNLIVFGETPLRGEKLLLVKLLEKQNLEHFNEPVFVIGEISFGVVICGDISWNKVGKFTEQKNISDQKTDVFIVLSNGIAAQFDKDSTGGKGYYLQADADSDRLCQVFYRNKPVSLIDNGRYHQSEKLRIEPFKKPKESASISKDSKTPELPPSASVSVSSKEKSPLLSHHLLQSPKVENPEETKKTQEKEHRKKKKKKMSPGGGSI